MVTHEDDGACGYRFRTDAAYLVSGRFTSTNPQQELSEIGAGMYLKPCFIPQEDMHGQLAQIENPSQLVTKIMGGNQYRPTDVGV